MQQWYTSTAHVVLSTGEILTKDEAKKLIKVNKKVNIEIKNKYGTIYYIKSIIYGYTRKGTQLELF